MSTIDLTQFDGHTAGPWRWEFNAKHRSASICGGVPANDLTVMDFARWGMSSAQPVFLEPGKVPTLHRLADRSDWVAPIAGREHHAHWCSTVTHPDARLMAAAPDLLAEVIRLRAALADAERKGAEAMREACADRAEECDQETERWEYAKYIRALPLPTGSQQ